MNKSKNSGFTLVELVIVIAVIAVLSSVLIVTFTGVYNSAKETAALQEVRSKIDEAYIEYISENNANPVAIKVTSTTDGTFEFVSEVVDESVELADDSPVVIMVEGDTEIILEWSEDGYNVTTRALAATTTAQ